jgi:hypothetical protein
MFGFPLGWRIQASETVGKVVTVNPSTNVEVIIIYFKFFTMNTSVWFCFKFHILIIAGEKRGKNRGL